MSRFGQDLTPNKESRFKIPKKSPASVSKRHSRQIQVSPQSRLPKLSTPLKKSPKRSLPTPHKANKLVESSKNSATPRIGATIINTPKEKLKVNRQVSFTKQYDRFIPNRSGIDSNTAQFHLKENDRQPTLDHSDFQYQEMLAKACGVALEKRILSYNSDPNVSDRPDPRTAFNKPTKIKPISKRRIPLVPEKVLDAPGIMDDFYLNLMDWSSMNILAVALEDTVYIWNGDTGQVHEFCKTSEDDYISSLKWTTDGSYLAVGTGLGDAQIWDIDSASKVRSMKGRTSRIGVLAWDQHIVSSGARDGGIWNHDVRVAKHKVAELLGHTSEVCGLAWRPDGSVLASGANDNKVQIWDARSSTPKMTKTCHTAAVKVTFHNKALAWCPWQISTLATGGGTGDHWLNFWNTNTGSKLNSIRADSQVTSIQWSTKYKEFVTSHGFPNNQLTIWSYPKLTKIADLPGHESRIINTCLSPDGETVASCASDENLKFWKVFEVPNKKKREEVDDNLTGTLERMTIR